MDTFSSPSLSGEVNFQEQAVYSFVLFFLFYGHNMKSPLVIVRGGGDIATGVACHLHNSGFRVLILETEQPTAIRRSVAFSEAVYDLSKTVQGITARLVGTDEQCEIQCELIWQKGQIPVVTDPTAKRVASQQPIALIDAIVAKKNLGTHRGMAPITIGLGPGFSAGNDVDAAIETLRGHNLGRIFFKGSPAENTGIPGEIDGSTSDRVVYSPNSGTVEIILDIGEMVNQGDPMARVGKTPAVAPVTGLIRGMIRNFSHVSGGFKIADIDPRLDQIDNCHTISDKARCVSGSVLEALLFLARKKNLLKIIQY